MREIRELRVGDPNLKPILFAAVDHVFDRAKRENAGFDGIYINRRLEPSLTAQARQRLDGDGVARLDTPAGCEALPSRAGPTPPTGTDKNGKPNPPIPVGTTHAPSPAICSRGFDYNYSFHMIRVAADSAYVETRIAGTARDATKCLVLAVAAKAAA